MLVICKRKPPKYYYYTRRKHQQQLNSMITTLLVVVLLLFMSVSRSSAASASNKIQYVKPSVRSHAFLTPKHGNITLVQGWLYSAASDKNDKLGLFARPMNSGGITISLSNLESFTKFAAPPGEPLLESSACAYNDGSSISRHAASSSSSTSVIYCLGGIDIFASKPPGFVNTLLAYNLNTRTWTAAHGVEMFNGMAMALTIFQNNILYTIGGNSACGPFRVSSENKREICDRLDHGIIFTHTLTPGAIAADGSLLPSSSPFSSTIISQKLLPTNNERSEFPSSKTGHCWVEWGAPGQFLYLFGGGDEIKATHIDSWSVTTNMEELSANWSVVHTLAADVKIGRPSGRISPTCVKRGPNDMYVFGGRGDGKLFSNDLWRLHRHSADSSSSSKNTSSASSPPLNKNDKWVWTLMTDHNKLENYIPSARAGANMVVAGDFLVVWGGYNNYDTQYSPVQGDDMFFFDLKRKSWTPAKASLDITTFTPDEVLFKAEDEQNAAASDQDTSADGSGNSHGNTQAEPRDFSSKWALVPICASIAVVMVCLLMWWYLWRRRRRRRLAAEVAASKEDAGRLNKRKHSGGGSGGNGKYNNRRASAAGFSDSGLATATAAGSGGNGGGAEGHFFVVEEFIPTIVDEISLRPGDEVMISHLYSDGWATGMNVTTKNIGVFPVICIRPLPPLMNDGKLLGGSSGAFDTNSNRLSTDLFAPNMPLNDATRPILDGLRPVKTMSIKTSNVFNYAAVDRSKTVGAAANHLPTSINTQAFMYNNNHSIDNAAGSLYVNAAIQLPQQHYLDAPLSAFPVDENVLFSTTVPVPRDSPISQSLAAEMYPGTASLSVEVDNGASMEAGSKLSGHSYDDIPLLHPPPTTSLPPPPPPTAAPSLSSSHHPTDNTLIIPSPVSMEVGLGGNNTVSANSSSAAATTTTSSLGESLHHTATVTTSGGCDSVDDSRDLRRQASESIIVVDSQEAHEYVIVRPKSIQSSCGDIVTPTTASLSTSAGREAGLLTRAISEQMSTSAGYIANSASRRKGGISHHKRSVTAASGLSVPVPDGDHFPIIKSGVVASTSYPPPTAHNRHSRKLSGQSSNSSSSSSISSSYNNNDRFPAGLATSGLNLNLVDAKPLDPVPEVEDNSFLEPLSIHGPEDCSSSTQLLQLQQQNHQEEAVPQPQDCDTRFLTMTSTTSKSSGQYDLAFNNQVEMDQILLCELQRAKTVKSVKSASKIHMTTNLPDLTVQIVDDHIATTSSTSRKMESSIVGGVSTTLDRCSTPTTTLKIPDPFANIVIPPRSHSRDLSGCCGDGDAAPIVPTSLEYEDMVQKNEEVVCTEVSIPVRSKSLVIDDGGGVVFMQHPTPPSTPKHRQSISSTASTETASSRSIRPSSSCSNVIIFDDRQPIASNLIEFCPPPPSFKDSPTLLARAVDGSLNVDDDEKEHDDGRGQMDTVLEMQFHEQQHPPPAPASEVTIQMTSKTAKRFSLFEKM